MPDDEDGQVRRHRSRFHETIRLDMRAASEPTAPHPMAPAPPPSPDAVPEVAEPLELLDAVLAALPTGILLLDVRGVIVGLNRAAARIFECSMDELMGVRLLDVRAELESMLWPADKQEVLLVGQGRPGERSFAETKVLGFSSRPVVGASGRRNGTVVVFSDITRTKREQATREHRRRLEDLGKVVATLAHEIRNPVFAIQSLAQVLALEMDASGPKDAREIIDRIIDECRRVEGLLGDLLVFGRKKKIRPRRIDLRAIGQDVVDVAQRRAADAMIEATVTFEAPGDGPIWWHADGDALRRVLTNLLRNGVEAIARRSDRKTGTVRLGVEAAANHVTLVVEDDGVGIPEEHIAEIFDEFVTATEGGTGLGLAVCRAIVEQHGGVIEMESVVGEGTSVKVVLPAPGASDGP